VRLSYEGYRALLIATVAAYLVYLIELLPALGLTPRKSLRAAALSTACCGVLVVCDLVLRRGLGWTGWGASPGNWLSALTVPFGFLAWLEVDRVRAPGVEAEPAWQWSPIRAFALKVSTLVIPVSLGLGVAFVSALAGAYLAWDYADMEPGMLRAGVLFVLLCINGAFVLVLRKRSRQTLRRAVVGAALTHIPLWWFLVFPTQFQASDWKRWPEGSEMRSDMAEDLVYSRALLDKTPSEVVELLGPPAGYSPLTSDTEYYPLHGRPCKGFVIYFDRGGVVRTRFWMCD
jgi:hypothetical protein